MAREDEHFVYQARRPIQQVDPAIRRIALGAGGVSVLVIVVALLWSGVHGAGFGPAPVITAPDTPLRVIPANPGGLTVPGANEQILSGDGSSAPPQLAPAQAAPDLSLLDQAAGISAPPAPVPAPAAAGANTPTEVQLAVLTEEPDAEAAWNALTRKLPQLFAGKSPEIVPAVVNGQSVWQLRLGGFSSSADAQAFCAKVTALGTACTVVAS